MNHPSGLPYHVGAGIADITPPLEVGLLMSSAERRWEKYLGVRMPLFARALMIRFHDRQIALVSLDLLGLSDSAVRGMGRFKSRIVEASGGRLDSVDLILTSTHTHTGPESLSLSDLYLTAPFEHWVETLAERIGQAIGSAINAAVPARMVYGSGLAPGLALHRRIKTIHGVVLSHPPPPPETVLSREGAIDESVGVVAFLDASQRRVGVLVNNACHPVHEMCMRYASGDYPGELSAALEARHTGRALFLNGASGNINPMGVLDGPGAAKEHADALACVVVEVLSRMVADEREGLAPSWLPVTLPSYADACARSGASSLETCVGALQIGSVGIVFLPGEPFVETGLAVRQASPFRQTLIVGGCESYIGYIPTDEAFAEGGYETGPGRWCRVTPGSERLLREAAVRVCSNVAGVGATQEFSCPTLPL